MKKGFLITSLFLIIFLSNFILAADVAYILRDNERVDEGFMGVFDEMNLDVDLIENWEVYFIDFSEYDFIFVGDERFRNAEDIPVNDYPSVIANYYYGEEWELTDRDGVSRLAADYPLSVDKKGPIIQVYDRARYKLGGSAIPYYFLANENILPKMEQVASTYTGNDYSLGDVISYSSSNSERKCFFGITKTEYWTEDAKELFKDCVMFVMGEGRVHDVMLDEDYEDSVDGIRIEDKVSGEFITGEDIQLIMCNDYEFRTKLKNVGDYIEDVTINGEISGDYSDSWSENKTGLDSGSYTTVIGKHSEDFCEGFEPGMYTLTYEAMIGDDVNPEDNMRQIQFELVLEYEPGLIHDVMIDEEYSNSVNGIRIKDAETDEYLLDETSQLMCSKKYKVDFKTKNVGDFTEDINFTGEFDDFIWTSSREDLESGSYTTAGSKTINITFAPGFYTIDIFADIIEDDNPGDNSAWRDVEVVCEA